MFVMIERSDGDTGATGFVQAFPGGVMSIGGWAAGIKHERLIQFLADDAISSAAQNRQDAGP